MAMDSAIASLPHALVAAHRRFCDAVLDLPNQTSTNAALEALRGFVYELRKISALSAELDRRATFIKNKCGNGSSWRQAADKALAILSKPPKTKDPLRDFR